MTATAAPRERARTRTVRCAIYTRKSTEEGLEQDFNSLDAQRESGEAYVLAQRHEGWTALPTCYDDGGYSGASMDRPALRRLLADIEAGRIDIVVVYKVDRLSRSLLDFSRILEVLDARDVAFVSVTQQFNTATSMGRLMLNVLLSFAQFERETIAERTRDKMRAARRKGKWTGGMPILGYDVAPGGGRLLVNEEEAARVRELFSTYLRVHSLGETAKALNARGWTTKEWVTKKGHLREGRRFTKNIVRSTLANRTYTGHVEHQGEIFPGEHDAIVDERTWRRAQEILAHNGRTGGRGVRNRHGALLKDLLRCAPCDAVMGHTYTVKDARRYRYYVCRRAQQEGWAQCPSKSIPAGEVEGFVVARLRAIAADGDLLAATAERARALHAERTATLEREGRAAERKLRGLTGELRGLLAANGNGDAAVAPERISALSDQIATSEERVRRLREDAVAASQDTVTDDDVAQAFGAFDAVWEALVAREQARLVRLLVEGIAYDGGEGTMEITFRPSGIRTLAADLGGGEA